MTTPLQPHIAPLLDRLARSFYEVVPHEYKTYCSLTARIAQRVLQRFGIACECVPCQVWYSQPHHHYVIGFLGPQNPNHNPGKWDGHVVCCTDRWLLDTATHHFQREFGLTAPDVVLTPLFAIPSTALAYLQLQDSNALWWHTPPMQADTQAPEEPPALVERYAQALIERLEAAA